MLWSTGICGLDGPGRLTETVGLVPMELPESLCVTTSATFVTSCSIRSGVSAVAAASTTGTGIWLDADFDFFAGQVAFLAGRFTAGRFTVETTSAALEPGFEVDHVT